MTSDTAPKLNARQQRILDAIRDYWREHRRAPTYRDLQLAAGISSTSVVRYNLKALERAGHIRMGANGYRVRSIWPVGGACPCCGREWER